MEEVREKLVNCCKGCMSSCRKFKLDKCCSACSSVYDKIKANKVITMTFWAVIFIVSFAQIALVTSLYGLHLEKSNAKVVRPTVRVMAKIIPLPKAFVTFDTVSYSRYIFEKDYTDHFMTATNQPSPGDAVIENEIVTMLVENKILDWQAVFHGVKVTKGDVNSALDTIIAQSGGQEKVESALKDYYGLSLKDFRVLVYDQLLRQKVDEKVIAKVTVRHILITVDAAATDEQVAAAKAKIEGYLAEINNGLDFSEAATKYSEDTGSATNGGSLPAFANGEMVQEFSDAAFGASVGSIVGPVRSEFGFHLIKVDAKSGTINKQFSDWLAGLKKNNIITPSISDTQV